MRRLLGLLITVIALWMGLVGPGSAAATPTLPTAANTYDTNHHSAHLEEGVCNRGPAASLFEAPTESADPWSSGPVARSPPLDATGVTSDYMNRAALGHNGSLRARPGAPAGVTTHGHSRAMDGDLLPFPARHVAANTGSRFAVNSAGEATMFPSAGSGSLEVTEHAALRLTQRGISIDAAEATLKQQPFRYFHNGTWKNGYYDPGSNIFLGSVDGRVTTVINNVKPGYIDNLKAAGP